MSQYSGMLAVVVAWKRISVSFATDEGPMISRINVRRTLDLADPFSVGWRGVAQNAVFDRLPQGEQAIRLVGNLGR